MTKLQTKAEQRLIQDYYDDLLKACDRKVSDEGKVRINKAFEFANSAHAGVKRKSGEPYIIHPIAVATIVVDEIGLSATSIISALLHDVVEDTDYTLEDISNLFGEKVASIVDGLTKLTDEFTPHQDSKQANNFRKMLMTLSDDVRVILIKIADRLHNMRTLDSMAPNKQLKIAAETLYIFSPLAHRLGLYAIKSELEDLSLKYKHPDSF
ncbi:MAG: HD domain-containing protein, partial [Bacteroidota bacterium]|nr:HD domain-containing protein [Bacteroidota bacterium]